ncbi:MAG: hypothetical protein E7166_02430 [Firmicutes bacterium]|nr:hypothetical protein [Bacillota bacterium]
MNDVTKRLAALILAGFMTTGISGCNYTVDPISYTHNTEKDGDLNVISTLDDLKNYYVIEVIDFEGEHRFYLTYKIKYNPSRQVAYEEYKVSGSSEIVVAKRYLNSQNYKGEYGEIVNVVEFIQYVQKYSVLKDNYKVKEIEEIMNKINDDYQKSKDVKTKSLTLK